MPDVDPAEITDPAPVADPEPEPTDDPPEVVGPPPAYGVGDDPTVPLSRFREVGVERDEERRQRHDLQGRYTELEQRHTELMERLEAPGAPAGPKAVNGLPDLSNLPQPPAGLDNLQTAYWHIREGLKRDLPQLLRENLGDSVDALPGVNLPAIQRTSVEQEWSDACREHGLDSEAVLTRLAVESLVRKGVKLDKAMKQLKEAGAVRAKRLATPVTTGAASSPTVEKVVPRDSEHAGALAASGRRIPSYGIKDVFRLREKSR